jgi:hypothetical protein
MARRGVPGRAPGTGVWLWMGDRAIAWRCVRRARLRALRYMPTTKQVGLSIHGSR